MHSANTSKLIKTLPGRRSRGVIPILFFIGLLIGFYSLFRVLEGGNSGDGWPQQIFVLSTLVILSYVLLTYKFFNTVYLFSNAYLMAFIIFHFGVVYQIVLGFVPGGAWVSGEFSYWIELACWYIMLSISMYLIGFSIGLIRPTLVAPNLKVKKQIFIELLKFARISGYGLLVASGIFFALAIASYGNILNYMREDIYSSSNDSRGLGVFMMVFPGAVTLLLITARNKSQRIAGYALAGFAFLLFMFSGYRSAGLFPALVGIIIWVKIGRKFPLPIAVISLVIVTISVSVFGNLRKMGTYAEIDTEDLKESYEQSTMTASFSELGQTAGIVAHTLRLVPEVNDHFNGSSYIRAFKGMFPNIGLRMNMKNSRADLGSTIKSDQRDMKKLNPSSWLTFHIKRAQFEKGGGVGFSAVAEPYLNFGTTGVIVFFLILGYFFARIDVTDLMVHPFLFVFCGTVLWWLVRTVRNDVANFFKPFGFILIILLIWHIGLRFLGKKYY